MNQVEHNVIAQLPYILWVMSAVSACVCMCGCVLFLDHTPFFLANTDELTLELTLHTDCCFRATHTHKHTQCHIRSDYEHELTVHTTSHKKSKRSHTFKSHILVKVFM